jgi:TIR domain
MLASKGEGEMPGWFLSYHSPDEKLAARLKGAVEGKAAALDVFFAPTHLRAGGAWTDQLAQKLAEADAFLLLIGEYGVGNWQVPEYFRRSTAGSSRGGLSRSSSFCSTGGPRPASSTRRRRIAERAHSP